MSRKTDQDLNSTSKATKTGKKFGSRATEFCSFMTSLGYQLPKYTKPEHYDHLFQNEETAKVVRQMMKEFSHKNVLYPDEIERFNRLKADGKVLFGADLQQALERRKCREIEKARLDQDAIDKDKELDRLIDEKKEQLRQIKAIDSVLSNAIVQNEVGRAISTAKLDSEQNHSEYLDREIQGKTDEIVKLTEMLQSRFDEIRCNISSGSELGNPVRLCDMDWLKMLAEEDSLNSLVRSMFEKHAAELIRQEIGSSGGGYNDLGNAFNSIPIMETESLHRLFSQHEKHLERLKHVIISEKIQEVEMDIEMAGCQASLGNMDKVKEEARLLSQADPVIQSRMLQDMQRNNERLEGTFRLEKLDLIGTEQEDEADRLNTEVKEIVDMRSRAKRNVHEIFAFLVNILVHQRVRVDLIRELIRAERTKNEEFAWKLHDYRNSVLHSSQKEETIHSELGLSTFESIELELVESLQKYNVPLSFYKNPLTSYQSLLALEAHNSLEKESNDLTDEREYHSKRNKISREIRQLEKLSQNLKIQTAASSKTPMEKAMCELEELHEVMEAKLKLHDLHKERLAKESVEKKLRLVKEVQGIVAQHTASKDHHHHDKHSSN